MPGGSSVDDGVRNLGNFTILYQGKPVWAKGPWDRGMFLKI
jgi:hypothetical protein